MANTGIRLGKTYKDYDFYFDTWNVLGLYRAGKLKQVKTELEKYRIESAKAKRQDGREGVWWKQKFYTDIWQ
jgi:hypothetical protein